MDKNKVDLLNGKLTATILRLAYPIAIATTIQMLYNLVDTFWLGKLGREALSAPVISFQVLFFLISIAIGFSVPATSLVSQYLGAKKKERAQLAAGNILLYIMVLSVLLAGIGLIFQKQILILLDTPRDTFALTFSYMRIILLGLPLAFPFFLYRSVMEGYGDTKSPLKIELMSVTGNLILDPLLIFGWLGFPQMGVAGAALATVIARTFSSAVGMYLIFSGKKGLKISLPDLKPDREILPMIWKIGLPAAVGMAGTSLGFIIIQKIVNNFGTVVISAYGIASRVIHLFMMPCMAIARAVTAMVGQNLGADQYRRAQNTLKKAVGLSVSFLIVPIALTMVMGQHILKAFIPQDPAVHQLGQTMFLIITPSLLFFALTAIIGGAFNGSGYTVPMMTVNIARIWLFRLPIIYVLSILVFGGPGNERAVLGIWWGMFFSNFLAYILIQVWYSTRGLKRGGRIQARA